MFFRFLSFCLALISTVQSVQADTIRLFGRSFEKSIAVWGASYAPPSVTERGRENAKFELYVRPSIELYRFNKRTVLVGYSIVSVIQNSQGFTYDNKITFSAGLELEHKLSKAVKIAVGGKWKIENEFTTGIRRDRLIFTADANLWKTFKPAWVRQRFREGTRLQLSGWANYRYPSSLHEYERNNGQLQGVIKLALAMPYKSTKLKIAPFSSLKLKADHKSRAYGNIIEPALGVELKIPINGGGSIAVGGKLAYEWRHATGTSEQGNTAYVSWYRRF